MFKLFYNQKILWNDKVKQTKHMIFACFLEMLTNHNRPARHDLYAKTNQKPFYFCKTVKTAVKQNPEPL